MHIEVFHPAPGDPLHPYVQGIFRVRSAAGYRQETILPKGNVDLLFNLGGRVVGAGPRPGPYVGEPGAVWLSGLKTEPFVMRPEPGFDLLGVCLRAEAAAAVLPCAMAELVNRELPGDDAGHGLTELGERLRERAGFGEQCALLTRWLLARARPRRGADAARHACALLRGARADDPVHGTARALRVSTRHLRRLVTAHVGIGPAEYVRLRRFAESLTLLRGPTGSVGAVAHAAGYYDHAHFCRDFRRFAGMTPQEYRAAAPHPTPGHVVQA
jgi:AraC-like DNA-binding protein